MSNTTHLSKNLKLRLARKEAMTAIATERSVRLVSDTKKRRAKFAKVCLDIKHEIKKAQRENNATMVSVLNISLNNIRSSANKMIKPHEAKRGYSELSKAFHNRRQLECATEALESGDLGLASRYIDKCADIKLSKVEVEKMKKAGRAALKAVERAEMQAEAAASDVAETEQALNA